MLRRCKRYLPLCVTLGIMAVVLAKSNGREVATRLAGVEPGWLAIALALFAPLVLGSALRWRGMVSPWCRLSVREASAQVLAASALNLALPSKLGDFSKAAFLRDQAAGTRRAAPQVQARAGAARGDGAPGLVQASAVVVVEKASDLFALIVLLMVGLALEGHGRVVAVMAAAFVAATAMLIGGWLIRSRRAGFASKATGPDDLPSAALTQPRWRQLAGAAIAPLAAWRLRLAVFVLWSWGLWSIHLTQMALLFRSAGIELPFERVLSRIPLAVVAGLVPWTVAGIGTRDSAILVLFSDTASAAALAVVGMLTALRYLVPGTIGLPILYRRLQRAKRRVELPPHQRLDNPEEPVAKREIRAPTGSSAASR